MVTRLRTLASVCVQAAAEKGDEGGTRDRVKERLQTVLGTLFQDLGTDSMGARIPIYSCSFAIRAFLVHS